MELMRVVILSLMMGVGSSAVFEAVLQRRACRWKWMAYTDVLAVTAGCLVIAYSGIPPYILQPARMIAVFFLVQQIYYRGRVAGKLSWSVLLCTAYWVLAGLASSAAVMLPSAGALTRAELLAHVRRMEHAAETVSVCAYLCLLLVFRSWYRRHVRRAPGRGMERYGYFPVAVLTVLMAVSMMSWDGTAAGNQARLAAVSAVAVLGVCGFYFITVLLGREEELQRMSLQQERAQNQMNLYRSMQKNYEQQRRYLHDYKNQLNCIQGMLEAGQEREAQAYLAGLTGSLKKHADYVDTGHAVVNVVLNQKYQEAAERGIMMVLTAGDLSGLRMAEEDLVTLLVNLLDNAIEACGRLGPDIERVIWFKLVEEDGQLVLGVRNPVEEQIRIRGKTIPSTKRDHRGHGIGLQNVDEVVRRNGGTSTLACEGGYFCFSAIFET